MPTTTVHHRPAAFLRRVLLADAAASGATGALVLLAAGPLAGLLGLPAGLLRGAGLVLVPWAALVAWLGTRADPPRPLVWAVVAGNALWAADSVLLVLAGGGWGAAPTGLGVAFVLAQALVVGAFAALQALGLRRAPAGAVAA